LSKRRRIYPTTNPGFVYSPLTSALNYAALEVANG
jgi:hypothetical protein